MKETIVTKNEEGYKLKKICTRFLSNAPVSFIYKMLRKKNIVLNDKKATGDEVLKKGDVIKYYLSDETIDKFRASKPAEVSKQKREGSEKNTDAPKIPIIYEDEDVIFAYKEEGVLSQKAKPGDYSMNEMIIDYLLHKGDISEESMEMFRPSVCNRLDRNTSGIILASKSPAGARALTSVIRSRELKKYYKAVVPGEADLEGIYRAYLKKDEKTNKVEISEVQGKDMSLIETAITLSEYNDDKDMSLLEIELITGKSHQIRAHLAYLGYPILGDIKYGRSIKLINTVYNNKYGIKSQMLTAWKVVFPIADQTDDAVLKRLSGKQFTCRLPKAYSKIFKCTGR
ncbi:MAG: RluA family pseudouridine synthase [Eubacterium sp.]|nr:RluA family pseudouridine synthase [Eubacterium sp.]